MDALEVFLGGGMVLFMFVAWSMGRELKRCYIKLSQNDAEIAHLRQVIVDFANERDNTYHQQ